MNLYKFIFSKLYYILDSFYDPFYSDIKAIATMSIIEGLLLMTLYSYFFEKTTGYIDVEFRIDYLVGAIIFSQKYYYFYYKNKWEQYIRDYKKIPNIKKKRLNIYFWIYILSSHLIVFVFAFRPFG